MDKLLLGVARFQRDVFPHLQSHQTTPGATPVPLALFITCSDARVVPNVITQTAPSELFSCQIVGNIVPAHGSAYGGVSATVEYAVTVLGVPDVIVCGHVDCGAMKVLLDPAPVADYPSLQEWLSHAEAARRTVLENAAPGTDRDTLLDRLTECNVTTQLTNLQTHPAIAARMAAGRVRLHGWVYDITTGKVRAHDPASGRFVEIAPPTPASEPNRAVTPQG